MNMRIHLLPRLRFVLSAVLPLLLLSPSSPAANWSQWRGPYFNGSTEETDLPSVFSKSENVRWVAELPGPSAATPIIHDNHVFISTVDDRQKKLMAMALDRRTGQTLWSHDVGIGISQDNRSNYASPSPATDGEIVVFFYGNGELVAYDFAGKKLWSRNIQKDYGEFAFQWTFSTSPLLHDGRLYLQVLQRDVPANGRGRRDGPNESYLLALNPKTGKELWRHIRPSDAKAESLEAFTTPVPASYKGREQILIAGGDCLTGHDPDSGKELWRWGTWNPTRIGHWRLVPSPVMGNGVVLACAPKNDPIYAVKADAQGTLPQDGYLWSSDDDRAISSDVCTPLFYRDHFFILNGDRNVISKVKPATGEVVWKGELGARVKIECSPSGGDGRIYFMNFRGDVFVVDAGDEFKLVHKTNMADAGDDQLRSVIAISQGNLFIRTGGKLYCVGR